MAVPETADFEGIQEFTACGPPFLLSLTGTVEMLLTFTSPMRVVMSWTVDRPIRGHKPTTNSQRSQKHWDTGASLPRRQLSEVDASDATYGETELTASHRRSGSNQRRTRPPPDPFEPFGP